MTGGSFRDDDTLLSWIVFPAILLVYLLFPTKNYYWDGIFFARVIEAAPGLHPSLLHPNHLLYNVFGYTLFRATQALGLNWRAIEVLQVVNCFVSVLTAYLLFRILRRSLHSRYLTSALTLLFAFSATWWKFSTDANAYIFSVFFLLLAFYFILPTNKPKPLLVALVFSVAVCFHQLAVICFPVMALGLFWHSASLSRQRRNFIVLQFCIGAFVLVFSSYYFGFYLASGNTSPLRLAQWVTSYSPDASFSFNLLSNLGYTLRGNVRLFFNARFSLLRGLISPPILVLLVGFVLLIPTWFFVLIRPLKTRRPIFSITNLRERLSRLFASHSVRLHSLWIALYLVFLFFWLPQNTFYRLFYLPAVILLLGELLAARGSVVSVKPGYRLGLFVAIMALSNFLLFIFPNAHVEKYPPLSLALEMSGVWQPGTVVYYASENSDNNLVAYFNPAIEWRPLHEFSQLEAELKDIYQQGKTAWFEASAIDQIQMKPAGNEWLAHHAKDGTRRERKVRGYNVKFVQVLP